MGFWDFLKFGSSGPSVITPLTSAEVRESARTFQFIREWKCGCGARLKIRSREDHSSGPSNFVVDPKGHATLSPSQLTWNGLAEERGWRVDPVECPACQVGLSVTDYKVARREGKL